ncbi:MAG: hypothetical protein H0Z35_00305 [Thermoanaerobacteraceae bacterium]|nr:hypothetical protein [Thermoanaerobacteraceae bacterium]
MWKNKLGNYFAYMFTALFVLTFCLIIFSGVFFGLFLFSRSAFASDAAVVNEKCFQCHGQKGFTVKVNGEIKSLYVSRDIYQSSMHGTNACTSCHQEGVEEIPHKNPIYGLELMQSITESCQTCHADIAKDYKSSVHGKLAQQRENTAYCSDCHGTHDILKKENPRALSYRLNVAENCARCHQGDVWETYNYSFHGKAEKLGYAEAATCTDCHGTHNILAADDPQSMVSAANRPETCATCHFYARDGFANGTEHVTPWDKEKAFPLYIVWKIFIVLILFDATKDGTIVIFELLRQLCSLNKSKKQEKTSQKSLKA